MSTIYTQAKSAYAAYGVDTEEAIRQLGEVPISIHCWQGDDVGGFDTKDKALTGGIQATGNYPGKARTPQELMADLTLAMSLMGGKKRLNLHASYAIFSDGEWCDRNALEPRHFEPWVAFAKEHGLGLDFNPTFFSHPMAADGLTLSHPDKRIREFWVEHAIACRKIASYFGSQLDSDCMFDVWIPDGYKDVPADRLGPRLRLKESLDRIFDAPMPHVLDCVESKVFGIGVESYTVGSAEFYLSYAAKKGFVYPLLDNGHYHPTEMVSDKIPALLAFFDKLPLHVTRPVRWDSDHVVLYEDELREIAKEIVRNHALDRVKIGLDYFDASINRVAAWVVGVRNMRKALLYALLQPNDTLRQLQDAGDHTKQMALSEESKTLPFGAVWDEVCRREQVPVGMAWYDVVKEYEETVLKNRD